MSVVGVDMKIFKAMALEILHISSSIIICSSFFTVGLFWSSL